MKTGLPRVDPATRPLTAAEAGAAVDVLVRAFQDDPPAVMLEPDPERRRVVMRSLLTTYVRASLEEASAPILVGTPVVGVALWFGPAIVAPSEGSLARAGGSDQQTAMGAAAFARSRALDDAIEAAHERLMSGRPHIRLSFLGVDPSQQGRGYGSLLLAAGAELADTASLPIHLETGGPRSRAIYEHHGYRVVDEYEVPRTTLRMWAMLREPGGGGRRP